MDLQAHSMIGTSSPRWAKIVALVCFVVAGGLLIGSLAKADRTGSAVLPSSHLSTAPIV